jgi:hypothetical protein
MAVVVDKGNAFAFTFLFKTATSAAKVAEASLDFAEWHTDLAAESDD